MGKLDLMPPLSERERVNRELYHKYFDDLLPEEHLREPDEMKRRINRYMEEAMVRLGRELFRSQQEMDSYDVNVIYHERFFPVELHRHNISHSWLEMLLVVSGECLQRLGGEIRMLRAGDVLLIPPGSQHAFIPLGDSCVMYNIYLLLPRFEESFQPILRNGSDLSIFLLKTLYAAESESYMLLHVGDYFAGENRLADLVQIWLHETEYVREKLNACVLLLLFELLSHQTQPAEVCYEGHADGRSRALIAYVQSHADTVTVQELCQVFSYSKRHIARIFQQITGQTAMEYIQTCREERFLSLLVGSSMSISRIQELCGIRSTSQFFRQFRDKYGMSPKEYRQCYGGKLANEG